MTQEGTEPVKIFLEAYTYIGEDEEGFHHHACAKTERVIVARDEGEQGGRHDFWMFLDRDTIDHVEPDLWTADDLEAWADYVDEKRGWRHRALETFPEMREQFMGGGRA
jgi:hypothetical protein